jgi:DNA adenine methylase
MESTAPVRPCGAHPNRREPRQTRCHRGDRSVDPLRIVETCLGRHRVYVEPFGGVDSLLLRKPRSPVEIYNDTGLEVVNLFQVMRDPLNLVRLIERLRWTEPAPGPAGERADPVERARRMLLRHWTAGRSGRANRWAVRGGANIMAACSPLRLPSDWTAVPAALRSIAARLSGVTVENRDPLQVIADYDSPQTLFYVAPPSVGAAGCSTVAVSGGVPRANADDAALAATLARIRGQVILRVRDGGWLRQLFPEWRAVRGLHCESSAGRTERALYLSPGPDGMHRIAWIDGKEQS